MITVTLKKLFFDGIVQFSDTAGKMSMTVEGHADCGVKGEDIVCAGVSALVQNYILSVSEVARLDLKVKQKSGSLKADIPLRGQGFFPLQVLTVLTHSLILGIQAMEKQYPEVIQLQILEK